MITGEGGWVHRMMPPPSWDCGPIPEECYNQALKRSDIEKILTPIYLDPERVRRLANSDDKIEILQTQIALEMLVEIDAETIWFHNQNL